MNKYFQIIGGVLLFIVPMFLIFKLNYSAEFVKFILFSLVIILIVGGVILFILGVIKFKEESEELDDDYDSETRGIQDG